ncbi:MAG: protein translocase subunit SecF [Bacillota bacterium]
MRIYDFMKFKYVWFSISGIALLIGLIFLIINGGLNLGIDFTGGTSIQANIGKDFDIEDVRSIAAGFDKEAIVTYAGNDNEIALIRTKLALDEQTQTDLISSFKGMFGIDATNMQFDVIGPAIGDELKQQALIALLLAMVGILLYVSIRFEWRFGIAAIASLFHDVLMMVAVFAVLQIPVNSSFIAAILTIVGYSINDTIVIFDKVRENIKFGKKMSTSEVINTSVSQTLARTINTSLTTLITIVVIFILGVPSLREFSLPLMVGIISGSYSTIFIASPVWIALKGKGKVGEALQ